MISRKEKVANKDAPANGRGKVVAQAVSDGLNAATSGEKEASG